MAVNAGIVLLITVLIVVAIATIVLVSWAFVASVAETGTTETIDLPLCSETVNYDDLVVIPSDQTSCTVNGRPTSLFYIGLINPDYDYVVASYPSLPNDVCIEFCESFSGGSCTGPDVGGSSAQDAYNNCISQLSGSQCVPPVPIAIRETELFYAVSPTGALCGGS